MIDAEWGSLPFEAAIAFFRDKLDMPTEKCLPAPLMMTT